MTHLAPEVSSPATPKARTGSGKAPKSGGYRCAECGWQAVKWVGRCGECQQWGTLAEIGAAVASLPAPSAVTTPAVPIADVSAEAAHAMPTGNAELDRVLGGGLVPGSVTLLAGEPGIGKSTLLISALASCARNGARVLYITGEESAAQVRLRAERVGAMDPQLFLAAETDLSAVLSHIDAVQPDVLVVDSIQTLSHPLVDGVVGGVNHVREVASALTKHAKTRGFACLLVGHVTKDGSIAGPRVLEHLVDTVLHIEGDRHTRLRLLRAVKNRFGAADEVGCFEMNDNGMWAVADPHGLFVTRVAEPVAGTCITVALEGRRPLLAEVQALVAATASSAPRRATAGVDSSRIAMLLAVLERRVGARLADREVYVSTVGGVKVSEPASDLAVALAVASASWQKPLPTGTIAMGEIGLAGEIRNIVGISARLAEAARLGMRRAIVPAGATKDVDHCGLTVIEAADVRDALAAVRVDS
jgi:DNA repair protein RadA/Sms